MGSTKLLVFHPALMPYKVDFFNSLNDSFNTIFYFNLSNGVSQQFDQNNLKSKCTFQCHYINNGFAFLGRYFRFGIVRIIKNSQPEIIICSEFSQITVVAFIYSRLINRNIKLYTISDDSLDNAKSRKGLRALFRNFISKNISGVIVPSEEVSIWYRENIDSKLKPLVLPIIHSDFELRKIYKSCIDQANYDIEKYDLNGEKIILFVGRLVEVKNIDFLIKCFSKVKIDSCKLVIIGDGPLKTSLELLVKKNKLNNDIIFAGRKEGKQLYSWYLIANIFVLPSTYEPFGAVINEALLGGCFILCSELAGASSLINKNNGLLFNPKNEQDLIKKLEKSINKSSVVNTKISTLRENKMPFNYEERIKPLIQSIKGDYSE